MCLLSLAPLQRVGHVTHVRSDRERKVEIAKESERDRLKSHPILDRELGCMFKAKTVKQELDVTLLPTFTVTEQRSRPKKKKKILLRSCDSASEF